MTFALHTAAVFLGVLSAGVSFAVLEDWISARRIRSPLKAFPKCKS